MFVFNINLNKTFWFKIFCVIVSIIIFVMFCICAYRIYNKANYFRISDNISNDTIYLSTSTYTNALKEVNENLDRYIGLKINFSGYVYRVYDLEKNQFVLARDMIINSKNQAVIVGFLCNFNSSDSIPDGTWINITGTIEKGNYHGDIPIIKISNLNLIDEPNDVYVYPPDENFIATNTII